MVVSGSKGGFLSGFSVVILSFKKKYDSLVSDWLISESLRWA